MTVGSLFTGIGGIDLGLERAGFTCRWQIEIDSYARQVLERHWPSVPKFEDVRTCGRSNLEPVDVIVGGFPCQPVSLAGKRRGSRDPRWLWPEFARILSELSPRFVLIENVAGLLSKGFGEILRDLSALGYDAEWTSLPACAVGAPHRRWRVFVLAYTNRISRRMEPFDKCGCHAPVLARRHGPPRPRSDANRNRRPERSERHSDAPFRIPAPRGNHPRGFCAALADADGERWEGDGRPLGEAPIFAGAGEELRHFAESSSSFWSAEPDVGRVAHGVPHRVDRLRGLGNAVVPQVAEWIGQRISAAVHNKN